MIKRSWDGVLPGARRFFLFSSSYRYYLPVVYPLTGPSRRLSTSDSSMKKML